MHLARILKGNEHSPTSCDDCTPNERDVPYYGQRNRDRDEREQQQPVSAEGLPEQQKPARERLLRKWATSQQWDQAFNKILPYAAGMLKKTRSSFSQHHHQRQDLRHALSQEHHALF
jgi:hypothetical protein